MVIGSEHFANPGRDAINLKVDSVLTEKKQQELVELVKALAEFKPTLVAIEKVTEAPEYIDNAYETFSDDDFKKFANESYQVGFRLAKMLGHKHVYGIDEQPSEGEPDYFPFDKLTKHIAATGQQEAFDQAFSTVKKRLEDFKAENDNKDMKSYFAALNNKNSPVIAYDFYFDLMKYDRGEEQPGAEIFAYYMMRNTKIASKLLNVAKPGDRVVIIYGAGHKAWLDYIFNHLTGVEVIDPVPYLTNESGH